MALEERSIVGLTARCTEGLSRDVVDENAKGSGKDGGPKEAHAGTSRVAFRNNPPSLFGQKLRVIVSPGAV